MLSRHPWACERGALWVMEFDGPARRIPVEAQVAATYSEVGAEAAGALVTAMGISDGAVVDRLADGSRCFVARVADGIAAYGWVSELVESIGELERPFHMREGEAYIWDCATLPEFRRQGLYTSLLHIIATTLQREGTPSPLDPRTRGATTPHLEASRRQDSSRSSRCTMCGCSALSMCG